MRYTLPKKSTRPETKVIAFRLPTQTIDDLKKIATREGLKLNTIVAHALSEYSNHFKIKKPGRRAR